MNGVYNPRLSLIPVLAERHGFGNIGRTALMKYMYFIQTLRNVPLGYHFSLYSYGPFDSDVLADLSSAEAMQSVTAEPIFFSGGYGYEIRPAVNANKIKHENSDFLASCQEDISWLFDNFGNLNASELELASTVIYVDREFSADNDPKPVSTAVIERVHEIKPHFTKERIGLTLEGLRRRKIL